MDYAQEDLIAKLKEWLTTDSYMLFTGAGFSIGAQTATGVELPTGRQLSARILTDLLELDAKSDKYDKLIGHSLAEIVDFCSEVKSNVAMRDYLLTQFEYCVPEPFHRTIMRYPWKKIFTTNIDDLIENACPAGHLLVQNQRHRRKSDNISSKIEYYKLHGCVRNPDGGFVFSSTEYLNRISENNNTLLSVYENDIQTENFIFLGFNETDIDIDAFLKYRENAGSRRGKVIYINPSDDPIFLQKLKRLRAYHLPITTKEFADIIEEVLPRLPANACDRNLRGFLDVNKRLIACAATARNESRLYFGEEPTWNDICFDWDFSFPVIKDIESAINGFDGRDDLMHRVLAIHGPLLSGKTVYLKRIGQILTKLGYQVYEPAENTVNLRRFLQDISHLPLKKIGLLIDDAPYYYKDIEDLVNNFPTDKELFVIGVGNTKNHFKKHYSVRTIPAYCDFDLGTGLSRRRKIEFCEEIIAKLTKKNSLGKLINKSKEEQIREINTKDDVCSLLFELTDSNRFKERMATHFRKDNRDEQFIKSRPVFIALAIFQKLELPGIPIETIVKWRGVDFPEIKIEIADYVKQNERGYASLRNKFLTRQILENATDKEKEDAIVGILRAIAPLVEGCHGSIWNIIQAGLIKVRDLRSVLRLSYPVIKSMLNRIEDSYFTDSNYWIQVGIYWQSQHDYEQAHLKLTQAHELSPNFYLAEHALARNYLIRAKDAENKKTAAELYATGEEKMLDLIRNREGAQIRAYSIHCYIDISIKYWSKFGITPSVGKIKEMRALLKTLSQHGQIDEKTEDVNARLIQFIRSNHLGRGISLTVEELKLTQNVSQISDDDLLDQDYPD